MAVIAGVSGALSAAGTIAQGRANVAAAKTEQMMLNQQAGEAQAIAGRDASAKKRETDTLLSNLQATAASSGGMGTDGTVLDLAGEIARTGNVQGRELLRQGEETANQTRYRGRLGVANAKQNQKLGYLTAGSQLLSGVSNAFTAYNSAPATAATTPFKTAQGTNSGYIGAWYS